MQNAAALHRTSASATAALGRVLTGSLLLAASKGDGPEQTVQVSLKGDGPLGTIQVLANAAGMAKGRVAGDALWAPPASSAGAAAVDVPSAVGRAGVLTVIRRDETLSEYTGAQQMGITELATGSVAEDLAKYLADSEQIQSALALSETLAPPPTDGATPGFCVASAGGFLLQALPEALPSTLSALEARVRAMPPLSTLLDDYEEGKERGKGRGGEGEGGGEGEEGPTLGERVAALVFGEEAGDLWETSGAMGVRRGPRRALGYGPCGTGDLRDRMLRTLRMLGAEDVRDILAKEGRVEMECDFCRELITFSPQELQTEGVL